MPWMVGSASLFYGVFAAIIGFIFIWHSWKVLVFNPNDPAFGNEKKLFVYSIKYLFLIFAALLVDTVIWSLV
jgi:protoheme IX farnesyltransferase